MKRLAIILMGIALAACGGEEHSDLKEELKTLTKDLRGRIDPLPVVKPYEPVAYQAADMPDPFGPAKIELVTKTGGPTTNKLKPDTERPKEPLETFPIETLKMVGVLQQGKTYSALIKADASLYRVKVGSYLGQNFGLITGISDNEIQLRELVQDAEGEWTERQGTLPLQEAGGGK